MFWFIVFIIVVGFIVEGASPKNRDKKSKYSTSKPISRMALKEIQEAERELRQSKESERERERSRRERAHRLRLSKPVVDTPSQSKSYVDSKNESAARKPQSESEDSQQTPSILAHELEKWGIKSLWHMTHIRNIPSIKRSGLLSHQSPRLKALSPVDISDPGVQRWRTKLDPCYGLALHEYVPFYINPRNPMLYKRKDIQNELCFVEVSLDALEDNDFLVSNGNAASSKTEFYDGIWGMQFLPWEVLRADFWTDFDDGKRKACSEILLPKSVDPKFIKAVHCYSSAEAGVLAQKGINTVVSTEKYFR